MQLVVLQNLACVLTDLDMTDAQIEVVMDAATPYLSAKQPVPLQVLIIMFVLTIFCTLYIIFCSRRLVLNFLPH